MNNLVIIGGSDAGISAALRAKEIESTTNISIIVEDAFPNYSICGIPFYLSGEVPDWHSLAHRTREEISQLGIHLLLDQTAQQIDPAEHQIKIAEHGGTVHTMIYDRLILATGAKSRRPHITGIHLPGVFLLRSMDDSFQVQKFLTEHPARKVIIVGGGYIGLEMADALTVRGLSVTLVEHGRFVLKTVDESLGELVQKELEQRGVIVETEIQVQNIESEKSQLCVRGTHGFEAIADLVLIAVGVEPRTELIGTTGIEQGIQGAIRVSRTMETNVPDIFAAGDCVETWHRLLNEPTYLPLGTTSHKQGRVAGENAFHGSALFAGTLGTQIVKIFDLVIARTGLRELEAATAGFIPFTIERTYWDHKVYYPGAKPVKIRLTGDSITGRLLGAQMGGHIRTEVAKRIDIFATALFHEMTIEKLLELDLSYTPPLGSPWDLVQMGAQDWLRAIHARSV